MTFTWKTTISVQVLENNFYVSLEDGECTLVLEVLSQHASIRGKYKRYIQDQVLKQPPLLKAKHFRTVEFLAEGFKQEETW